MMPAPSVGRVREGGFQGIFNFLVDTIQITENIIVPKPQYDKSLRLKPGIPSHIFLILIMLSAVNFDHQFSFIAHKINNVSTNNSLPAEFDAHAF